MREHIDGFGDAFLADTATTLGVRETRRIVGVTTLTGAEVADGVRQADAIARGAWPREYHVRDRGTEYEFLPPGVAYDVPFGALRTREIANLLVAGRCISADHDALASTRVMAPSLALGEAAGTAAALAVRIRLRGRRPRRRGRGGAAGRAPRRGRPARLTAPRVSRRGTTCHDLRP